ncbi:MAG: ribonuclease E/G [Desulfobacterales bacterium]
MKTIIKNGQELMVQVTKEPFMKKGAMLTTFISLPGRNVVLMPGSKMWGCPEKIEDEAERKRIKETMGKMLPEGFGGDCPYAGQNAPRQICPRNSGI